MRLPRDGDRLRWTKTPWCESDRGSVMILTLGLIVVCLMAVAVVVDASTVFLARRSLQASVDSAALAGAQAIDLDYYFTHGAADGIPLDPTAVRAAVTRQMSATDSVRLEGVRVDGGEVLVRAQTQVSPPFSGWLIGGGGHTLTAEAGATLTYRP